LKEKDVEIITGEKNIEGNRVIKIRKLLPKTRRMLKEKMVVKMIGYLTYIHRLGYSDVFECDKCPQKGDIHYMKQHVC
jgi:hypothetical protein